VRRGDTLTAIARRHRTDVASIMSWNRLRSPHKIRQGTRLVLYPSQRAKAARSATAIGSVSSAASSSGDARTITYRVRRGDSLYAIARAHGVSVRDLKRWNSLARGRFIHPGDRLSLHLPNGG
jgi:membrane-bound lytic murein transglycosylase D